MDVRIHDAHTQSGKAQTGAPHRGQHPVRSSVRNLASKLGVNHSQDSGKGHLLDRKKILLHFPFIMHLYAYHECTTVDEDDKLLTAREEIAYKLQPVPHTSSSEGDPPISKAPPSSPGSPPKSFRRVGSLPPPSPHHPRPFPRHPPQSPHAAGPSQSQVETPWQNVDLSTWQFPENPFQRVFADLSDLQTQYYRLEHITRGANQALNDCGPGNILRVLVKRADQKELHQANESSNGLRR